MITIGVIKQNVYDKQHLSKYYAENKANFVNIVNFACVVVID